ncbi:hypothetical protein CP557_01180 [Natrinema ejinorense]|uniref:Uncharacterized protein n=1 Tax=Natrinema ejinorense TaxID=373386 RepID=A0A2A5QR91_9EURY|nr:hypothetical protein CP557_01180 [Natrinema ejinorense]
MWQPRRLRRRASVDVALDDPVSKRLGVDSPSMADDDADGAIEHEAEREAEIEDELERIDRDPDEVDTGDDDLVGGTA